MPSCASTKLTLPGTTLLRWQVREGPLNLPLFRKPLDLSLRRLKRLGKHDDLRLSIFGVA